MAPEVLQETGVILKFITRTLPAVGQELDRWQQVAADCLERDLYKQAISSLSTKRFHAQGGSVYMLLTSRDSYDLVRLIVALQTISDYLDNLCDRGGYAGEAGFWQLHQAMFDAVHPHYIPTDYYKHYPYRQDRGYLVGLVRQCSSLVAKLPGYDGIQRDITALISLYCHLQTYKHLPWSSREKRLQDWIEPHLKHYPDLYWWEFAAATGSTLGVFTLLAYGASPGMKEEQSRRLTDGYFPWICGLHILLDYLIDLEEDAIGGDLNFVSYYPHLALREERLVLFVRRALEAAASLPQPSFHRTVVRGLLALYLSDPKVEKQGLTPLAHRLLSVGGKRAWQYYRACLLLRRLGTI
ncbi:MAG: tetraprenyl-beta-curcumene synthase family protein [Limnochordia bacterium]